MGCRGVRRALSSGLASWLLFVTCGGCSPLDSAGDATRATADTAPDARSVSGSTPTHEVRGVAFVWNDPALPAADFGADLAQCARRSVEDPWLARQPAFNRAILEIGCMQKRGWQRVAADPPATRP
jgi:hypothetical protein